MERGWTPALVVNTPGFASCARVQIDGFPMRTTSVSIDPVGRSPEWFPRDAYTLPIAEQRLRVGDFDRLSIRGTCCWRPGGPFDPTR